MRIGAQLYTVREFTKTPEAFSETLKKIADIGYKTVQVSGTCPYEAAWLRDELKKNGLTCVLTHTGAQGLLRETEHVCLDHEIFGCQNIGLGAVPGGKLTDEIYEKFVAEFMPVAKKIHAMGKRFFYHNHAFEFSRDREGRRFIDRLTEDFPAELLSITLDTYWVQFAGADPVEWLDKLVGRAECIHLKDMTATFNNGNRMAPVGYGNMNFEKIVDAAGRAGTEYLLVEQDDCYGEDPFACLEKSYRYLISLGLNA